MVEVEHASMKEIKVGKYIMVDETPCRVVNIDVSAPGKHGAAKMRVTAIGIFDGNKKIVLKPSDADVDIPIIERKRGQIVTMTANVAQVMDLTTFENTEMPIPEDLMPSAEVGKEVEYMETMGKRMITRIA